MIISKHTRNVLWFILISIGVIGGFSSFIYLVESCALACMDPKEAQRRADECEKIGWKPHTARKTQGRHIGKPTNVVCLPPEYWK